MDTCFIQGVQLDLGRWSMNNFMNLRSRQASYCFLFLFIHLMHKTYTTLIASLAVRQSRLLLVSRERHMMCNQNTKKEALGGSVGGILERIKSRFIAKMG